MEKVGLVLSGGGSKGAYEAGVYKALRKLHQKIDIVTGTSIGAVNGIFVVQKDLRGLMKFWKTMEYSTMYKEEEFPPLEGDDIKKMYLQYAKAFINEGGLDISKMNKIFDRFFKPFWFFRSNIDYGLVTYNLSKRKGIIKTKKDLTPKNARDFVTASASAYPAFKPRVIDNELYVDGGYYDNIPINLALKLGAEKIIAVDLRAVGFKPKVSDESIEITYIAPRNKIASFLMFDKERAKEAIKYGYNDTMKVYGKLDGNKLTFRKGHLVRNYNKYNDIYEDSLNEIFKNPNNKLLKKIFETKVFEEILNRKTLYKNFNQIVEKAGEIFNFDETVIYDIYSYNKGLIKLLSETEAIDIEKITKKLKDKNLKNIIDSRQIVKYFYSSIVNKDQAMFKYILPMQDEFLTALYIYILTK